MSLQDSPFWQIMEQAKNEFLAFGKKIPPGSTVCYPADFEARFLRLINGKDIASVFKKVVIMESITPTEESGSLVLIIPNDPEYLKKGMELFSKLPNYTKNILIMPRYGAICQKIMAESGMQDQITVSEFHADILLIEPYEFLVPAPRTFRKLFIEGDIDDLYSISRALVKIEALHGMFPKVITIGESSKRVAHLLHEMKAQIGMGAFIQAPSYNTLVVIDRTCDQLTPLLTQLTYNGVLDETMRPSCGFLKLPDEVNYDRREIIISDSDPVFTDIRGLKLPEAGAFVDERLKEISAVGASLVPGMEPAKFKVQSAKAQSLADRKPYFTLHLDIMSYLSMAKSKSEIYADALTFELQYLLGVNPPFEIAEKLMMKDENWIEVLRHYCISSQIKRGLPSREMAMLRRRLVARFGLDYIAEIENLERAGLLYQAQSLLNFIGRPAAFSTVAQTFNLLPKNPDDEPAVAAFNRDDLGSFYDGYVPLLVRLAQYAVSGELSAGPKAKVLEQMHIPVDTEIVVEENGIQDAELRKVVVFVIGGMTSSEAIAIREMGKRIFQGSVDFSVGSTSLVTNASILGEICPALAKAS